MDIVVFSFPDTNTNANGICFKLMPCFRKPWITHSCLNGSAIALNVASTNHVFVFDKNVNMYSVKKTRCRRDPTVTLPCKKSSGMRSVFILKPSSVGLVGRLPWRILLAILAYESGFGGEVAGALVEIWRIWGKIRHGRSWSRDWRTR